MAPVKIRRVTLDLKLTHGSDLRPKAQRPFDRTPGFSSQWWSGLAKIPVSWVQVTDPMRGEVARAELLHRSQIGLAYPTWTVPRGGALQIHLLEVRSDMQGRSIGLATLAMIQEELDGPYVALSRDEASDMFWRRAGWREHDHEETVENRRRGERQLHSQLFTHL